MGGRADVWPIPIVGFELTDISFSFQITFVAYGKNGDETVGAPSAQIQLGGAFRFRSADGREHHLDAEAPWSALTPLLALPRRAKIATATADRDAKLEVTFDNGSALSADPDDHYENWEVVLPGGVHLIAPPGGGDPGIPR